MKGIMTTEFSFPPIESIASIKVCVRARALRASVSDKTKELLKGFDIEGYTQQCAASEQRFKENENTTHFLSNK